MVGGDASTFARAQLNAMIGGKKWTWQEFTALVEGNFQSSNEKDWNRKAVISKAGPNTDGYVHHKV